LSPEKDDCRCVVADIRTLPTPVIAAPAGEQTGESGASFLHKPFDPEALFGLVTRSLAA